jgi:hypothetical protein
MFRRSRSEKNITKFEGMIREGGGGLRFRIDEGANNHDRNELARFYHNLYFVKNGTYK